MELKAANWGTGNPLNVNSLLSNYIIISRAFNKRLKKDMQLDGCNLPLTILLLLSGRERALKSQLIELLGSNYYVINNSITALLASGLIQKCMEPKFFPAFKVMQKVYYYSLTVKGQKAVENFQRELLNAI